MEAGLRWLTTPASFQHAANDHGDKQSAANEKRVAFLCFARDGRVDRPERARRRCFSAFREYSFDRIVPLVGQVVALGPHVQQLFTRALAHSFDKGRIDGSHATRKMMGKCSILPRRFPRRNHSCWPLLDAF
jgi:hypothetical protein